MAKTEYEKWLGKAYKQLRKLDNKRRKLLEKREHLDKLVDEADDDFLCFEAAIQAYGQRPRKGA